MSGSAPPGGPPAHGGVLTSLQWSRHRALVILTTSAFCLPTSLAARVVLQALPRPRTLLRRLLPPQRSRLHRLPRPRPQNLQVPLRPLAQGLLLLERQPTGDSVVALAGLGRRLVLARIPVRCRICGTRSVCKPEVSGIYGIGHSWSINTFFVNKCTRLRCMYNVG